MSAGRVEGVAPRTKIGKYRVIAELGRGAMAHVYLGCLDAPSEFKKLVVLKVLRPMFANDAELRTMFFDEARLAARLNHPNVVQTYEVGSDGEDHFLTMEYLEGQSLSAIRRAEWAHPMSIALHLRTLTEVCAGLHYAHELTDYDGTPLKMVHRDVTPNNLFVTYDGQIKLLDFGVAKAAWNSIRTQSGVIRGTMGYISPEQILGIEVDRRADIFAVGVMLWEAVTRVRMWPGMQDVAIMQAILDGAIQAPRTVNPNVPAALDRICMKALARKREERYATAAELQADLEDFVDQLAPHVGVRESGKFVAELFSDTRERMRVLIERQLSRGEDGRSASSPPPALASTPPAGAAPDTSPKRRTVSTAPAAPAVAQPSAENEARAARVRIGMVVLVLAALAVLATFAAQTRRARARAEERAEAEAAARLAAQTAPPRDAHVRVTATPKEARIYFDDALLPGNPATKIAPRGEAEHAVRVESAGFAPAQIGVVVEGDVDLHFALTPAAPAPSPDADAGGANGDATKKRGAGDGDTRGAP
jgi:serine/threonine-protein kinase